MAVAGQPLFAQEAANAQAPFTLTISGNLKAGDRWHWDFANESETVRKVGEIVVIAVQKTNVSNHEIPKISKWGNYFVGEQFDVRDSTGNLVRPLPPKTVGSFRSATPGEKEPVLEPGQSDISSARLDDQFDLSQPGTYTIQAWAHAWDDPKSPIVRSNTLTLIIGPANAPAATPPGDSAPGPAQASPSPVVPAQGQTEPAATWVVSPPGPGIPAPTFTLHIAEDPSAARIAPGYHRIAVTFTRTSPGVEIEQFHPESKEMYNMIVTRDGQPVPELPALRALEDYRKADRYPTVTNPRMLQPGQSWMTLLDISDYFDMTKAGVYEVTVTRQSQPLNLAYSVPVRSNTIRITVAPGTPAPVVPDADKPKPRFDLVVGPEIGRGENGALLRVEMDNTSDSTIREYTCSAFMGMYNLSVWWNGVPLEANGQMKRLQELRSGVDCSANVWPEAIEPGKSGAEDIPVAAFFDVSKPGTYAVLVTRETYPWQPTKSVRVESNMYTFDVPEPTSSQGSAPEP